MNTQVQAGMPCSSEVPSLLLIEKPQPEAP